MLKTSTRWTFLVEKAPITIRSSHPTTIILDPFLCKWEIVSLIYSSIESNTRINSKQSMGVLDSRPPWISATLWIWGRWPRTSQWTCLSTSSGKESTLKHNHKNIFHNLPGMTPGLSLTRSFYMGGTPRAVISHSHPNTQKWWRSYLWRRQWWWRWWRWSWWWGRLWRWFWWSR